MAFFERHHVELTRWAYMLTGYRLTAEDVVMETFEIVLRRWDSVSNARNPLAYTRRILVNQVSASYRRRTRDLEHGFVLDGDYAARGAQGQWEDVVLARLDVLPLLEELPERRRMCVVLRFGLDLSERETAEVLGVSVGTVKSQTSRALAHLRERLPALRELS